MASGSNGGSPRWSGRRPSADHPAVTTEQPDATASTSARPTPRPLRRRATDRVLGGVASGIADYFSIDPLVVRAFFVGLMIFGGSGLVLYVGAWLLIPVEGQDDSPVEAGIRSLGASPGRVGLFLLILLALFVLFVVLPHGGGYIVFGAPIGIDPPGLVVVVLVVVLGIVLLRRGAQPSPAASGVSPAAAAGASSAFAGSVTWPEARVRDPRGPLAMVTLAVALIVVGALALLDTARADISVTLAQLLGLALGIVGAGLVIGSWWGNARLLILLAIVLLPLAWATSYMRVPLEGGVGSTWHYIDDVAMIQPEYRLVAGDLTIDLRTIEEAEEPIAITASVAMGALYVLLPPGADIEVTSRVGAGEISILDSQERGTDLAAEVSRNGPGPRFVLDLSTGIGPVRVETHEPDALEEQQLEVCDPGRPGLCVPGYDEPMPTRDVPEEVMP